MGGPWNSSGIEGTVRWIRRVWTLFNESAGKKMPQAASSPGVRRALRRKVHQTLQQVTHDFENFEFNTVVSALMELLNEMYKAGDQGAVGTAEWDEAVDYYLRMMAPVAPHVAEELWTETLGRPYSVHIQPWPEFDPEAAEEDEITLVVQVNGKVRDRIVVPADISDEDAKQTALASEAIQKYLDGKSPKKVVVVPGKLVNIVV
jgi:leucyl-tRNA synthetase